MSEEISDEGHSAEEVPKKRPQPKGGSRAGRPNKTTATLKEAILMAAELSGRDMKGKDGLVGYLQRVADEDVKAFSGLLGKVLPLTVTSEGPGLKIVVSQVQNDL